ncbi:DUF6169 family protein [Olivibacter sp. XZL3]|uniref:DUF6169 family protein n=1 Tax=Olivibacter sp. XZL3 TaxID=1735116 RepID=UPI001064FEC9|nr:DUF6169 family protein [Olivibacter sp. XZL3]
MLNHYNYVFDNLTNTYNFVTKNNILYRVAFVVDYTFSIISGEDIQNIFQLVIEKASDDLEPFDAKVSKTIEDIIKRFFQNTENSLVYICSDEDNKAGIRHKIFDRWYKNSEYRKTIIKINNILPVKVTGIGVQRIYTSFMFHTRNKNVEKLIKTYQQIEKALNESK